MSRPVSLACPIVLAAVAAVPTAAPAQNPLIRDLGVLPGCSWYRAYGVSDDGTVAVGSCWGASTGYRAFRWTASAGMTDLGTLPGYATAEAFDVSGDGAILVGECTAYPLYRAFRWTEAGGMQELPGGNASAEAISGDGSTIVGLLIPQGAVRWTSAGMAAIPSGYRASAVSHDGAVIVGTAYIPDQRAFRWDASSGTRFLWPLAGHTQASASAISGDSAVIAGWSGWNTVYGIAARWPTVGYLHSIGSMPLSTSAYATAMTFEGSVVVGVSHLDYVIYRPFLWTAASGMQNLNTYLPALGIDLSRWNLKTVEDITPDGTAMVGWGTHDGQERAWLAVVPCYANCDSSTGAPQLSVADFACFLGRFSAGAAYANCDGSTTRPTLNVADFSCFLQRYAAGCP